MFTALAGLFIAAFLAATWMVPLQSEVVFVGLQAAQAAPVWMLVLVASVANTLGSFVNYWLGMQVHRFQNRSWYPVSPAGMAKAEGWYQRFGIWTLLISWAPLGDAITLLAGMMRTPLWQFALLVATAKTGRFIVLAWLTGAALVQVGG